MPEHHCPQQKIEVFIYADLETFHQAIGYPDAPEWVVAAGLDGKIRMVTPRLITSDLADKGAVHELVHVLQSEVNTDAPVWMNEGIAMYEAGQSEGVSEIVVKGVQEDNIPPLDVLDTQDTEAFAQAGGYAYAYTVVEFAVQTYGKDILAEWVKTPRDYQRVFGVTKETFEKQWMDQLLELYSP